MSNEALAPSISLAMSPELPTTIAPQNEGMDALHLHTPPNFQVLTPMTWGVLEQLQFSHDPKMMKKRKSSFHVLFASSSWRRPTIHVHKSVDFVEESRKGGGGTGNHQQQKRSATFKKATTELHNRTNTATDPTVNANVNMHWHAPVYSINMQDQDYSVWTGGATC